MVGGKLGVRKRKALISSFHLGIPNDTLRERSYARRTCEEEGIGDGDTMNCTPPRSHTPMRDLPDFEYV